MGADGHIGIIKVKDREWYKGGGDKEFEEFVENYYKEKFPDTYLVFSPYYYEDFAGIKGLDVIIIYYGDGAWSYMESGLYAIEDNPEFSKRFKGKLEFVKIYEVWT